MRIARNAVATSVQVAASALILFVLYRFILNTVGAEKLGVWSIVLATASASRIGDLGLSASVTRFVAKYRARGEDTIVGYILQTASISIAVLLGAALLIFYPLLSLLFEHLFSGEALVDAYAILPFALVSFVLIAVAAVFQSGLDGCQRYDIRALLYVAAQLLFLIAAFWLLPRFGLVGLAWAQLGQGVFLMVGGWVLVRRLVKGLPILPRYWRRDSFLEMLRFGLQFQAGAIAMMLFDPLTKALLGKYGGLSAAGYYQMASQFVSKVRLLIVSANQVLVPVAATLNEQDPRSLEHLYRQNLGLLFIVVMPLFALVAAWAPLLSELWIGRYEPQFVFFVDVLAVVWALNTFCSPAYFAQLGTGQIGWNTIAQVWTGLVNAIAGFSLGPHFGAPGIIAALASALLSGSALVLFGFHRVQKISWRVAASGKAIGPGVASVLAAAGTHYLYRALMDEATILRYAVCILVPLLVLGNVLWFHPERATVKDLIEKMIGRRPSAE